MTQYRIEQGGELAVENRLSSPKVRRKIDELVRRARARGFRVCRASELESGSQAAGESAPPLRNGHERTSQRAGLPAHSEEAPD